MAPIDAPSSFRTELGFVGGGPRPYENPPKEAHTGRVVSDAGAFLAGLQPGSVGLMITDPPWDLQGSGRFDDVAAYARLSVADVVGVLRHALTALRPGAHAYIYAPCGDELREFMSLMHTDGWRFQRILGWEKGRAGLGAYQNAWEPVLIYSKGQAAPYRANGQHKSLLKYDRPAGRTAKPWQTYKVFMEMSSDPGDLVIDPFCGSNPLATACGYLVPPRRWLACDIETPEAIAARLGRADTTGKGRRARRLARGEYEPGQVLLGGEA